MNPDPNQPQDPAQTPAPDTTPLETPVSVVETPVSTEPAAAPNPFGASTPASTEAPAAAPFGGQPAAPIGSTPGAAPLPGPAPKSNKKLIILIAAIVGGLLVIAGIAIAVYLMFFSVTKADYKQAYDQLKTVQTSVASGSITSDTDNLSTAFDTFKAQNAKLGELKALKADKDLNVLYKAYDSKAKAYVTYMEAFIPSFEKLQTVTKAMTSGSGGITKSSSVQATIDAIEAAGDVPNPAVKAYLDGLLGVYKEILPQAKIYETATSTSAQKLAAITAISKSTKALSTVSTTFSTDIKDGYEGISPKESFDALSKAVTEKYNKK